MNSLPQRSWPSDGILKLYSTHLLSSEVSQDRSVRNSSTSLVPACVKLRALIANRQRSTRASPLS